MSDFLGNLAAKSLNPTEAIRPRPLSTFEPPPREAGPPPVLSLAWAADSRPTAGDEPEAWPAAPAPAISAAAVPPVDRLESAALADAGHRSLPGSGSPGAGPSLAGRLPMLPFGSSRSQPAAADGLFAPKSPPARPENGPELPSSLRLPELLALFRERAQPSLGTPPGQPPGSLAVAPSREADHPGPVGMDRDAESGSEQSGFSPLEHPPFDLAPGSYPRPQPALGRGADPSAWPLSVPAPLAEGSEQQTAQLESLSSVASQQRPVAVSEEPRAVLRDQGLHAQGLARQGLAAQRGLEPGSPAPASAAVPWPGRQEAVVVQTWPARAELDHTAPPAGRETPTAGRDAASAPVVQVTIGRVEVRAERSRPAPTRSSPEPPLMSLEEYLRQRNGGGR